MKYFIWINVLEEDIEAGGGCPGIILYIFNLIFCSACVMLSVHFPGWCIFCVRPEGESANRWDAVRLQSGI